MADVRIEASWKTALAQEFAQPYFDEIRRFLHAEKQAGKTIFPPGSLIFNAFEHVPFDQVKVVILGQDPYHQPRQAMGLSFSVPKSVAVPPSLVNIYKELQKDIQGFEMPRHGDLTHWAEQGVFLLNAILTVERARASSHAKIGWQHFTDAVIRKISAERNGVVFMLWGRFAKEKKALIDASRHLVLEAAHPSPLAGNAFSGCQHFSKANQYLIDQGKTPINWQV